MLVDAQAGDESALALMTAVDHGIHFILHAAGIFGAYISMSLEKFLLDEEICAMIRRMVKPLPVTDQTIGVDAICEVGPGGHYLTRPETTKLCRKELFQPKLMSRQNHESWSAAGSKDLSKRAHEKLKGRLESWKAPDIPPSLRADIVKKAKELAGSAPLRAS